MKLHFKEVLIGANSVKFLYAHKELYKQELQLSKGGDILDSRYQDFEDKQITRREVRQSVLNKDHRQYSHIRKIEEELKQEGKYIATEENTFTPILNGFEGELSEKIKAVQFLTGFIGRGIISLEKDTDFCRRFWDVERNKGVSGVFNCYALYGKGSLFVAKDC